MNEKPPVEVNPTGGSVLEVASLAASSIQQFRSDHKVATGIRNEWRRDR